MQYFDLTSIFTANLSLSLCQLAASHSFWLPLSSLACTPFHSFIWPLPIIILSLSILICYGLIHCLLHLSGGFSETYAALCDYNGIGCKEEVQWVRTLYRLYRSSSVCCAFNILLSSFAQLEKHWNRFYVTVPYLCYRFFFLSSFFLSFFPSLLQDVDTIYHSQDNREFNLLDFSHLDSRWDSLLPP